MFEQDRVYYQRRAEIEARQAERADRPEVAEAHRRLTQAYLAKLAAAEPVSGEMP